MNFTQPFFIQESLSIHRNPLNLVRVVFASLVSFLGSLAHTVLPAETGHIRASDHWISGIERILDWSVDYDSMDHLHYLVLYCKRLDEWLAKSQIEILPFESDRTSYKYGLASPTVDSKMMPRRSATSDSFSPPSIVVSTEICRS